MSGYHPTSPNHLVAQHGWDDYDFGEIHPDELDEAHHKEHEEMAAGRPLESVTGEKYLGHPHTHIFNDRRTSG